MCVLRVCSIEDTYVLTVKPFLECLVKIYSANSSGDGKCPTAFLPRFFRAVFCFFFVHQSHNEEYPSEFSFSWTKRIHTHRHSFPKKIARKIENFYGNIYFWIDASFKIKSKVSTHIKNNNFNQLNFYLSFFCLFKII